MQGFGIVLGAFILLLFLSFQADQGGFFRSALPTSTSSVATERSIGERTETIAAPPREQLSEQEIERRIKRIYRELDRLDEKLRAQKLREPASPYQDMVTLRIGGARRTDPEREYLTLRAAHSNDRAVNISDWYLESYVTERRAALPQGARLLESTWSFKDADIDLLPGERAYIVTAESPLNVSFHENTCTGYLSERKDFYPSLSPRCPYPLDELEDSDVRLDDDACYDFVERMGICRMVDEDNIEAIDDLTGRCERFLEDTLNYNGCVKKHRGEPLFDDVGDWRIYLDRGRELWRSEREIIRLIDGDDRVVDVIEY